jgi:hypothetical protein
LPRPLSKRQAKHAAEEQERNPDEDREVPGCGQDVFLECGVGV